MSESSTVDVQRDVYGFCIADNDPQDRINNERVAEAQKRLWMNFLESRNNRFDETWLWQYWKDENRQKNQINKKLMTMFSSRLTAQKQIKDLIRKGVPDELRGKVWWACSGGKQKMEAATTFEQFGALVQRFNELKDTQYEIDIEKDINRTYPNSTLLGKPQTLASLRKVLMAYALRNPVIGYCQSMNFVCCMLLIHLSEEQAFWVFAAIIEDIAPKDYYDPSMIGSRIDQMVFESCVAWKLPTLYNHFKEMNMMLEPVTCPWLLCLYATALPMEYACRIWDCLLWEGNVVIFRVGLAMLKMKLKKLLAAEDFIEVYSILRSPRSTAYDTASMKPKREPIGYIDYSACSNAASKVSFGSEAKRVTDNLKTSLVNTVASAENATALEGANRLSKVDSLMYLAFDKNWMKSIPRDRISAMRSKFRKVLEAQNLAKLEEVRVPRGVAHMKDGTLTKPGDTSSVFQLGDDDSDKRRTVHSHLLHMTMEDIMSW